MMIAIVFLKLLRREERLRCACISRLANPPSLYGILTDHNAGANVKRARIAQHAQDGSYLMKRCLLSSSRPNRVTLKALFNNVVTFKKSELHVPTCY